MSSLFYLVRIKYLGRFLIELELLHKGTDIGMHSINAKGKCRGINQYSRKKTGFFSLKRPAFLNPVRFAAFTQGAGLPGCHAGLQTL